MSYIGHALADLGIPVFIICLIVLGFLFYEYFLKK